MTLMRSFVPPGVDKTNSWFTLPDSVRPLTKFSVPAVPGRPD